jgi:hypothetical protein
LSPYFQESVPVKKFFHAAIWSEFLADKMAVFEKILRFWAERGGKKSGFMVKY